MSNTRWRPCPEVYISNAAYAVTIPFKHRHTSVCAKEREKMEKRREWWKCPLDRFHYDHTDDGGHTLMLTSRELNFLHSCFNHRVELASPLTIDQKSAVDAQNQRILDVLGVG